MAKPRKKPAADNLPVTFVGATILPSEVATSRYTYSAQDAAMVQRCISQSMAIAVSKNATVCADQRIRLYRKAAGGGAKLWPGRRISRKQADFLSGQRRWTPGRKAIQYAQDAGDIEEVLDHPASHLIRKPDPRTSGTDFLTLMFWFREALGKTFLYKAREMDGSGYPTSLYHLFPQWVRIQADRQVFISGYWYGRNRAQETFYDAADVLYGRFMQSPDHPLYTWSWPQALQLEGDVENAALQAEIARWNNGGNPGMVIELDEKTTPEQVKQIVAEIHAQVRGVQKTGMPLILRRAKANAIGVKPIEMNYEKGLLSVRDQIFLAAGWVESMWKMGSAALASAERADPTYMGQTIAPRIAKVAEELTDDLLPDFGVEPGEMWFAFDNPVAEDREALIKEATSLIEVGIINQPEAREMLEIEDSEVVDDKYRYRGVDVDASNRAGPLQTTSLQALVESVTNGDMPAPNAKAIAAASMPQILPENLNAIFDGLKVKPQPEPGAVAPGDGAGGGGPAAKPGNPSMDGQGGSDGAVAGDAGVSKAARRVKDARLPNQPKEVSGAIDALQAKLQPWYERAMKGAVTDSGAVDLEPYLAELHAIMAAGLPAILAAAANDAAASLDGEVGAATVHGALWAKEEAARLVTNVSESLRSALAQRVSDGVAASKTMNEIQADIAAEAPDFSLARSENIARTETSAAANEGSRLAYKDNGITYKDFIVAGDPCPVCAEIKATHGSIPIDQPYYVDGEPKMGPPFHPQCRCDLIPGEEP